MNDNSDFKIPVFDFGSIGEGDATTVITSGSP